MKSKRIKHNDLTHYFLRSHEQLPASYLASCEKFFKSIKQQAHRVQSAKQQATSFKQQAPAGIPEVEKKLKNT